MKKYDANDGPCITFVEQRQHAVVVVVAAAPPVAGAMEVDGKVGLLPAVLLQRPPQLLVAPHQVQHLARRPHLPLRALAAKDTHTRRISAN